MLGIVCTSLILSDKNLDVLIAKINTEFKKVSDYFRLSKLALHPQKTKFIIFSNSHEIRSREVLIRLNFNNDAETQNAQLINNLVRVTMESETPAIKCWVFSLIPSSHSNSTLTQFLANLQNPYFFKEQQKTL